MSKCKSNDFECNCDKFDECEENSNSKHSCGPIDIKVHCCPPDDNGNGNGNGDDGCCCNEGMAEALRFIQELQNRGDVESPGGSDRFFIDIFGINPNGLATNVRIVNVIGDDIVRVDATSPAGTLYISTCAIYYINVRIDNNSDFDEIQAELRERFTVGESDDCCCKDGLANLLNMFVGDEVELNLNDADGDRNDAEGEVIALNNDVVWLDTTPGNSQGNRILTVASICYIASVRPIQQDQA